MGRRRLEMSIVEEYEYIAKRMADLNRTTPKSYPIWNLPEGEYVFRFLPDGNADNPCFWVMKPSRQPFWRKSAVFQGFVISAPDGVEVPKNIIQKIIIPDTAMQGP
jgi:hypothetical protein